MNHINTSARRSGLAVGRPKSSSVRDGILLGAILLFLTTEVFTGMLRWALSQVDKRALALIYLPKCLMALALIGCVAAWLLKGRISKILGAVLLLCGLCALIGAVYTKNIFQVGFGIYLLVPLLFGILSMETLLRHQKGVLWAAGLLWLAAATGVFLDFAKDLPWEGATYSLAGLDVQMSREWITFGVERAAGFSRASFFAADQLLLLGLVIVVLGRHRSIKLLVWLITGVAIALTTTKKGFAAYAMVTFLLMALKVGLLSRRSALLWKAVPLILALFCVAMPLSTLVINYQLDLDSYISQFLFLSFEIRLVTNWPNAFRFVSEHGNPLLGRGLGGMGASLVYFEPELSLSPDNLFLQLYTMLGILSLPIILAFAVLFARLRPWEDPRDTLFGLIGVSALFMGWTGIVVLSPVIAVFLGITLKYACMRSRETRPRVYVVNSSSTALPVPQLTPNT